MAEDTNSLITNLTEITIGLYNSTSSLKDVVSKLTQALKEGNIDSKLDSTLNYVTTISNKSNDIYNNQINLAKNTALPTGLPVTNITTAIDTSKTSKSLDSILSTLVGIDYKMALILGALGVTNTLAPEDQQKIKTNQPTAKQLLENQSENQKDNSEDRKSSWWARFIQKLAPQDMWELDPSSKTGLRKKDNPKTISDVLASQVRDATSSTNLGGAIGAVLGASFGPIGAAIGGFLGNQVGELINDHVLSIPKTSAAYYRAQYLAGMQINNFKGGSSFSNVGGLGDYLGEYAEVGDYFKTRQDSRVVYDQLRMYANTIGIKNDEFYKKFSDFIGAGGKFTENAVTNFKTSMTYEKQFGESFSMDFLNIFERVTGSTGDLNKHIQVLTGVAGNLTTVSQKHVQALSENFYSTLRGHYDGETTRRALGRELALFTPLLSKGVVDSNEISELLNIGKGQGVNQRMTAAAFMPAYGGNFLGGAEAILQNTITPQGRLKNFENYMSLLKVFTGGQSISSLSDEQMTVLRAQASNVVPAALLDKAVLKQLEEATNSEERDKILNRILNGQSASEEAAQSLHAMEEPLKAIRDNVVAWGVTGRLKREFSDEMKEEQLSRTKYLGSFGDDKFTLDEYFNASSQRREQILKAVNRHGISSTDFDTYAKIKMYGTDDQKTKEYKELIMRVERALEIIATQVSATAENTKSIDNKQDSGAGV